MFFIGVRYVGNGTDIGGVFQQNNGYFCGYSILLCWRSDGVDPPRIDVPLAGTGIADLEIVSWGRALGSIGRLDLGFADGVVENVRGLVAGVCVMRAFVCDGGCAEPGPLQLVAVGRVDDLAGHHQAQRGDGRSCILGPFRKHRAVEKTGEMACVAGALFGFGIGRRLFVRSDSMESLRDFLEDFRPSGVSIHDSGRRTFSRTRPDLGHEIGK